MSSEDWIELTQLGSMAEAEILLGRLKAEGIPGRAWQEGAGRALGLTVGYLGTVHLLIPPEFEEKATEILYMDFTEREAEEETWQEGVEVEYLEDLEDVEDQWDDEK